MLPISKTLDLTLRDFVVDYLAWRIKQDGLEWFEQPALPFGTQPEHVMMRQVAHIFERRHRNELNEFADELLENEDLTFSRYCEIVDEFGRTADELENGMSYGRLVGLISFGGLVAARMYARNFRREVRQLATYTAKFIDKRIRLTWVEDARSWKNFMTIGADIIRRDALQREVEERRRASRRWSLIGIGAAALVGVGAIIGTRILLGAK
uniref:BH4_2 domain-containing protein n=1 Tax=Haemonchus contortus TaxID=6289 RepID=A0A7I5E9G9_HAECO